MERGRLLSLLYFSFHDCLYHRVGRLKCRDSADMQYMAIQKNLSKYQKRLAYKPSWQRTIHLRVFLWQKRLPVAWECIAKVPNQELAKRAKCFSFFFLLLSSSFFRRASSILRQPLALVYARNSSFFYGAVHDPIAFSQLRILARLT